MSLTKTAPADGYFALVFVAALPLFQVLPRLPQGLDLAIYVSVWSLGWLFAISGVRRSRGGSRVAAIVSLVVLVLHAALLLIITRI